MYRGQVAAELTDITLVSPLSTVLTEHEPTGTTAELSNGSGGASAIELVVVVTDRAAAAAVVVQDPGTACNILSEQMAVVFSTSLFTVMPAVGTSACTVTHEVISPTELDPLKNQQLN
jgi:hypothetical protein